MRIALVNDYSLDQITGAAMSMFEQKRALEVAGHTVTILQLGAPIPGRKDNIIYIQPSYTLPKAIFGLPILKNTPENYSTIRGILIKHKIEIIHLQSELSLAHLVVKAATELKLPVFYTIHTLFWQYDGPAAGIVAGITKKFFENIFRTKIIDHGATGNAMEQLLKNITLGIAARSNVVISPSQHQKMAIEHTKIETPVVVLPNPFGISSTQPAKQISNAAHDLRFVWVGRCVSEKRPLEFLAAVQRARVQSDIPFHVDIVGDGALLTKMKAQFALANVTYHGRKSHETTVALMDQGDIVCTSSYHFDNQPMIIAEALTRYRPVFYCDERLSEGVDIAGYLTKDETPEAMAAGIIDLLEHSEKVVELSKKAKQASRIFGRETYAKNVTKLYQS